MLLFYSYFIIISLLFVNIVLSNADLYIFLTTSNLSHFLDERLTTKDLKVRFRSNKENLLFKLDSYAGKYSSIKIIDHEFNSTELGGLQAISNGNCAKYKWNLKAHVPVETCISLGNSVWYGGPELYSHHFAFGSTIGGVNYEKADNFLEYQHHALDAISGGDSKLKWINSDGISLSVNSEDTNLKLSFNDQNRSNVNSYGYLCFQPIATPLIAKNINFEFCHFSNPSDIWYSSSKKSILPKNENYYKSEKISNSLNSIVWHANSILPEGYTQSDVILLSQKIYSQSISRNVADGEFDENNMNTQPPTIRIVFVGDSLIRRAQVGFHMLDNIAEALTAKHPSLIFELINAGLDGNRIQNVEDRLDRDVFSYQPQAVVLYWDSDVSDVEESLLSDSEIYTIRLKYENSLRKVITRIKSHCEYLVVSGPTLLGEKPHGLNNRDIKTDAYRRINQRVTSEMNVDYIDTRAAFFAAIPVTTSICGLPSPPIVNTFTLPPVFQLKASFACWLSSWTAEGFSLLVSSFSRFFGMGIRDKTDKKVTVDGEHLNQRGANIAGGLFTEALDKWINTRAAISTIILDHWYDSEGDFRYSSSRFPDPVAMVRNLHDLQFKVILTVTPFCDTTSQFCHSNLDDVSQQIWRTKYTTSRINNNINLNNNLRGGSSYNNNNDDYMLLDLAYEPSKQYFQDKLRGLRVDYNVDGFYYIVDDRIYDINNSSSWFSSDESLSSTSIFTESQYIISFLSLGGNDGLFGETFADSTIGTHSAVMPSVLVPDITPTWGFDNGLATVVTRALSLSAVYHSATYVGSLSRTVVDVLQDGTIVTELPDIELYVRWLQACVLLPLQMKIGPWEYTGNDRIKAMEAFQEVISTRSNLVNEIHRAIKDTKVNQIPLIRPIWAMENDDKSDITSADSVSSLSGKFYDVEDEYKIGSNLLVAPILLKGQKERNVVFPKGSWMPCLNSNNSLPTIIGPVSISFSTKKSSSVACFLNAET